MKSMGIMKCVVSGCFLVVSVLVLACSSPAATAPAGVASPAATTGAAGATAPAAGAVAVPSPYTGMKDPFSPTDSAAVAAGQAIFQQNCLTCHGAKGDGSGPAGASLSPKPANFTASPFKEKFTTAQDELFWRVSEGWPGTAMPSFKGQLSEQQRWQVITYEWTLSTGGQ